MIFRQMVLCVSLVLLCGSSTSGQQVDTPYEKSNLLDVPYVIVYRAGEQNGTKFHHPEMVTEFGKEFLRGQSAAENSNETYLVSWAHVEMIRRPNVEILPGRELNSSDSIPASFQLSLMKKKMAQIEIATSELVWELAKCKQFISTLQRELKDSDSARPHDHIAAEIRILNDELEYRVDRLERLDAEGSALRLEYLKMRRDAVANQQMK